MALPENISLEIVVEVGDGGDAPVSRNRVAIIEQTLADETGAAQEPDEEIPVAMAEQNVGARVVIEISEAGHVPGAGEPRRIGNELGANKIGRTHEPDFE